MNKDKPKPQFALYNEVKNPFQMNSLPKERVYPFEWVDTKKKKIRTVFYLFMS